MEEREDRTATCSAPIVDIGFPADVQLGFCGGELCRVELRVQAGDDGLFKTWKKLSAALRERYGAPRNRLSVPSACLGRMDRCITAGTAQLRSDWRWPNGQTVRLQIAGKKKSRYISIGYELAKTAGL